MYEINLALNNLQWSIYHKIKRNQICTLILHSYWLSEINCNKFLLESFQSCWNLFCILFHPLVYKPISMDGLYNTTKRLCLSLPLDRTWQKVNDPKLGLKWRLGEGKVGHGPRHEPCWTLLVIGSISVMWAWSA